LFSLAVSNRVLDPELAEMLVIVVTISMVVSPLLMSLHTNVIEPRLAKPEQREFDRVESQDSRVIIAGFGRFGQIIGRVLRMRRIRSRRSKAVSRRSTSCAASATRCTTATPRAWKSCKRRGRRAPKCSCLRSTTSMRQCGPPIWCGGTSRISRSWRGAQSPARVATHGYRRALFHRETYLSSLDLAQHTLEALGLTRADAIESIRRFDAHDRKQLQAQREIRDDEQKLIQSAQQAARELEQLFEADTDDGSAEGTAPRAG
jgi:glutathione-regulated potassium-efflux system ancillary protein KefC/glutathione-regulated potassium-efflux system protein KefB